MSGTGRRRIDLARLFEARRSAGSRRNLRLFRDVATLGQTPPPHVPPARPCKRPRNDPWQSGVGTANHSTGRIRIDRTGGSSPTRPSSRAPDQSSVPEPRKIEKPAAFVVTVLEGTSRLSPSDTAALSAARKAVAGAQDWALLAVSRMSAHSLAEHGADRIARWPQTTASQYAPEAMATRLAWIADRTPVRRFVFPHTTPMLEIARRLSALLQVEPALGVFRLAGEECAFQTADRQHTITAPTPEVISVLPEAGTNTPSRPGEARPFENEPVPASQTLAIENMGPLPVAADDIDMEEAPFILCAGAGVDDWSSFERLAARLNAKRGGTRVVCDAGLMGRDRQIGASGHSVSAECYVALGLSGAIQHLQGIENCETVIAVNSDPAAPIIDRADQAIIFDVNALLAETASLLEKEEPA